jgi:hypothetical protein
MLRVIAQLAAQAPHEDAQRMGCAGYTPHPYSDNRIVIVRMRRVASTGDGWEVCCGGTLVG